jgi:uncharacterized protein (DUF697 family)
MYETYETYEQEQEQEQEQEYGELPSEMEMELAAELLEITNEQELEQFLGDLVKGVGSFIRGPIGQAVGGVLKNVAKTALPAVGGALGTFIAPGVGTAIGSQLGSFASKALGEYEVAGEQEFEVARKVVQLAHAAGQHAAVAPPNIPPQAVAEEAVLRAAQQVAPGIQAGLPGGQQSELEYGHAQRGHSHTSSSGVRGYGGYGGYGAYGDYGDYSADGGYGSDGGAESSPRGYSGRWIRRGRRIILFGI